MHPEKTSITQKTNICTGAKCMSYSGLEKDDVTKKQKGEVLAARTGFRAVESKMMRIPYFWRIAA